MDVAPDQSSNLGMAVEDLEQRLGILESYGVEPPTPGFDWMMVQTHQSVVVWMGRERSVKVRKFRSGQMAGGLARQMGVEHHEQPRPQEGAPATLERGFVQRVSQGRRDIVVARQAKDGCFGMPEGCTDMLVACRIIVHKIPRQEDGIPIGTGTAGMAQYPFQRAQRIVIAQVRVRITEQVQVGQLQQSEGPGVRHVGFGWRRRNQRARVPSLPPRLGGER